MPCAPRSTRCAEPRSPSSTTSCAGALVMFIVALARPQIVRASVESVSEGIDVVLAVDVSGSMSEAGFGGSTKIDAVKRVVNDFLGGLRNDRVGIVIFSGEAIVLG